MIGCSGSSRISAALSVLPPLNRRKKFWRDAFSRYVKLFFAPGSGSSSLRILSFHKVIPPRCRPSRQGASTRRGRTKTQHPIKRTTDGSLLLRKYPNSTRSNHCERFAVMTSITKTFLPRRPIFRPGFRNGENSMSRNRFLRSRPRSGRYARASRNFSISNRG